MKKMNKSTFLVRGQLLDSGRVADVLVRDGLVRDFSVEKPLGKPDLGSDETLLGPALVDMQVNGGFGIDLQRDDLVLDEVAELSLPLGQGGAPLGIAALLKSAGLAASSGEGNRLIDGGGVRIDSNVVSDKGLKLGAGCYVLQVGKRKFARVTLG